MLHHVAWFSLILDILDTAVTGVHPPAARSDMQVLKPQFQSRDRVVPKISTQAMHLRSVHLGLWVFQWSRVPW